MDQRTKFVKSGIWTDHAVDSIWKKYRLLVTDSTAQVISNAVAVALTLALPRLLILLKLALPHIPTSVSKCWGFLGSGLQSIWLFKRQHHSRSTAQDTLGAGNNEYNLDNIDNPQPIHIPNQSSRILSGFHRTIQESTSFEDAAVLLATHHLPMAHIQLQLGDRRNGTRQIVRQLFKNLREDAVGFAVISILAFFMYAWFIGNQILAISSAKIVGGPMGLLQSPTCGYYAANLSEYSLIQFLHDTTKVITDEFPSVEAYAQKCYLQDANVEECNLFYTRAIKFNETEDAKCPFIGNVCVGENASAYGFNTGFTDINVLGINVAEPFYFSRSLVCSPVAADERFIQYRKDESDSEVVDYYYSSDGPSHTSQPTKTFTQDVHLSSIHDGLAGYIVESHTQASNNQNFSFVRSEFQPLNEGQVTLAFIRPNEIQYLFPSNDPVFPTTGNATMNGGGCIYFNHLAYSTVLGCVDKKEIKDPKTDLIWNVYGDRLYDHKRNYDFWLKSGDLNISSYPHISRERLAALKLLALSMIRSDFKIPISLLLGRSLDAASKVISGLSFQLDSKQWIVEARKAFVISLARIQADIRDIALGSGGEGESFLNLAKDWDIDICGFTKAQTTGWKNINLSELIMLMVLVLALWILPIKVGDRIVLLWLCSIFLRRVLKPAWAFAKLLTRKLIASLYYYLRAIQKVRGRLSFYAARATSPSVE